MLLYIVKRVLRSLLSILIVTSFVFIMLRMLPVEGYFGARYDLLTPEQRELELYRMGLLDPMHVQLINFLRPVFTEFDFGLSMRIRVNVPVSQVIADRVPISLQFSGIAIATAIPAGMTLGVLMSRRGKIDKAGTAFVALMNAIPAPVFMIMIQLYGTQLLGLPLTFSFHNPATRILPIFTIALPFVAFYANWMRRFMVDESNKDYIMLAKIKNVPSRTIFFGHIFRNAVVPITNLVPITVLNTIWGSIVVERLYSIPGMGGLLIDSILARDNALTQALVVILSTVGILALLLGDLLMALVDPRIRLQSKGAAR